MNELVPNPPPPERRWLKFVLLGGALLVMFIGIPLIWLGSEFVRLQQRQAVIDRIVSSEGYVSYDHSMQDISDRPLVQRVMMPIFGEKSYLDVYHVSLGRLDSEEGLESLANFPTLQELYINGSTLTDEQIKTLAQFPLSAIFLEDTRISPKQLHMLLENTEIEDVSLGGYAASDEHLRQLEDFPRIVCVSISQRALTADSFQPLAALPNLELLAFASLGKAPPGTFTPLGQMKHVKQLYFSADVVDDELIDAISQMDSLRDIFCYGESRTECRGKTLAHLGRLKQLRRLKAGPISFDDEALRGLSTATQLEAVECEGSQITDTGVADLGSLQELVNLFIPGAQLSEAGIQRLLRLPKLEMIDLGEDAMRLRSDRFALP